MRNYVLEACVDSIESAISAMEGGATRLEMCSNLIIGGTTPSTALFQLARNLVDIEINVLIRPRYGDFLYTDYEFQVICESVKQFRELGADGVVVGCLCPDGTLDLERMKILREAAGSMNMTLHRAFDVCRDPLKTLESAVALGMQTILTSGQQNVCLEGAELIKTLVERAAGKLDILVGSGVNASVIAAMIASTGARSYHMSGKIVLDSQMLYKKEGIEMGISGLSEFQIFRTSEDEIRKSRAVMEELLCL